MTRLRAVLALTITYLALTANLEFLNVLVGVLLATAVTFLIPVGSGRTRWVRLPTAVGALLIYTLILMRDLLSSGLQVARIVLSRHIEIQPGIVAIPADTKTDLGTTLLAHAITLTPGELVVEIGEEGSMYTHVLDARQAEEAIVSAQTKRRNLLEKIFT